jgi:carboxyl-terminal processing protease
MLPPLEPDRTPTEPTIEPGPPAATPVVPGPSLAPATAAAGRGRRSWLKGAVITAALVATFAVGIGVGTAGALATTPSPEPQDKEFALIREAWDTLHKQYVARAELDDQALAWGSIKGMTEAVGDTGHTSFMTPAERAANAAGLSGTYVGIGVKVGPAADGRPLIITVFKDSPAEKAGLRAGDIVVNVDGKETTGHDISEVIDWIRGEAGTKVAVTVRNGVDGEDRPYTLERADVPVQSVSWTMVPGSRTALLALDSFSNGAADEVVAALKDIKQAGAERLILDLRGNPGGYVDEAVGVASQFLTKGDVYIERDADGHETHHPVSADGVATDIPLVVLVDGGTASSAEIVSGALQDAKRGQIIGVATYGTGTVLGEFPLSDGSAMRIGTVEWLTPSGRRIWHEGIVPDVVVERATDVAAVSPDEVRGFTPAEVGAVKDPQLAKALSVVASIS